MMRDLLISVLVVALGLSPALSPSRATGKPACQQSQVVVYMTTWCPYCKKLRHFLTENQVSFREVDIERDPVPKEVGQVLRGVPLSWTERGWIHGYNETRFRLHLCMH